MHNIDKIDEEYSNLVADVILFIEKVKLSNERDISLVDIISDYCFKKDIEPEMMGDAIKNDVYFKSFIQKDCESYNIMNNATDKMKDW